LRRLLSVRARATAAAVLTAMIAFTAGAMWMRHVVYEERMTAAERLAKVQAEDLSSFIAFTGIASPDKAACQGTDACWAFLPAKTLERAVRGQDR
jgi:hypothetical protein